MHKIGLKIWSTNSFYVKPALDLYERLVFDYIELYITPGSQKEYLKIWQEVEIPFILHAPHSFSGLNLSLSEFEKKNRELIEEVEYFRNVLSPEMIIFHPGTDGSINETIRQIKLFKSEYNKVFDRVLIENKPKVGLNEESCLGASPEEIKRVIEETDVGFCLDIGHAVCYASWAGLEWASVVKNFIRLSPEMYHLSDGDVRSTKDSHPHLGEGNYDLYKMIRMIPLNAFVSIETGKNTEIDLDDFEGDVKYYRRILCGV
jgi:sugar phosphate isomerase/epimerase